ncbi:MAG: hypothetical protein QHH26_13330 [Armatimonadota bacterium]|nr:hypothetical protein [Armatimonadota bacterium]
MKNYAWRLGKKDGVAYIENRKLAMEILKIESSRPRSTGGIMATYYSPGGKEFAWQVRFPVEHWGLVMQALGIETMLHHCHSEKGNGSQSKKKSRRSVTRAAARFSRSKGS